MPRSIASSLMPLELTAATDASASTSHLKSGRVPLCAGSRDFPSARADFPPSPACLKCTMHMDVGHMVIVAVVTPEKIVVSNCSDYRAVLWHEEWRRSSGPRRMPRFGTPAAKKAMGKQRT
ncbi:hypothetical protein ACFX1W_039359 [Malus domestica]